MAVLKFSVTGIFKDKDFTEVLKQYLPKEIETFFVEEAAAVSDDEIEGLSFLVTAMVNGKKTYIIRKITYDVVYKYYTTIKLARDLGMPNSEKNAFLLETISTVQNHYKEVVARQKSENI